MKVSSVVLWRFVFGGLPCRLHVILVYHPVLRLVFLGFSQLMLPCLDITLEVVLEIPCKTTPRKLVANTG